MKNILSILALLSLVLSMNAHSGYSPFGDIHWKAPVATVSLLGTTGNLIGDARVDQQTSQIYIWTGSTWANAGTAGSGNVTGPLSSVNNDIVTFSGTTGTVIQDSGTSLSGGMMSLTGLTSTSLNSSAITDVSLTNSTAVISNNSNQLISSQTTATELGYVHGVTSSIQTQINGLQPTGNYITALTGDVSASGPGSVSSTLATVNSNTGSFGSSTAIPTVTLNGKGLVTAASTNAVIAPAGTLTGTTLSTTVVNSSLNTFGASALNNLLPSQTGNTGKFLQTSGSSTSWASGNSGTVTSVNFVGDGTVLSTVASPSVTSSGSVYAVTLAQASSTFLAGPISGANAAPTFRTFASTDFVAPTVQVFTSGSGTYTTPVSPRSPVYLKVTVIGGGGGGGSTAGGDGTVGNNTTFGTSLITSNGGAGGTSNNNTPVAGGSASVTASATVLKLVAVSGGGGTSGSNGVTVVGGPGGNSILGGGGAGGTATGQNGATNTGAGGGGAGNASGGAGTGGGAGGTSIAIINNPSATYPYSVGGTANGASGGANAGGNGAAGIIIVEEHYQ